MKARASGFTLIELLVVLAIVATLLTIALPRYYNTVDGSKETVLVQNLHTTREAIEKFYGDKGRYPETLEELVDSRYLRSVPVDPVADSAATWIIVAPPAEVKGKVYDIKSGSPGQTRDGRALKDL